MPEFVKHRRFSDEMVRRYLDNYYVFDPVLRLIGGASGGSASCR